LPGLPQGQVLAELIEIPAEAVQHLLGKTVLGAHKPVLDLIVLGYQDRQDPIPTQVDELDMLEAYALGAGAQHQGGMPAHQGEHPGGLAE